MSIVELQKRARRLGEIRMGDKSDKGFPISLDTFRLTSSAKELLEEVGNLYGGTVEPWNDRWQIVTESDGLAVVVPPQDPDSVTWYESWTAGGLQRRCDGEHIVNRGDPLPCVCDPTNRECRMVTRLQVMIPELPDVGVWTLSSTGYYAAAELAMSIDIVMRAAQTTGLLPDAVLAIEHREVKRPGEPTKKFVVPVLRFTDSLATFLPGRDSPPSLPGRAGAASLPGGTEGRVEPERPVHDAPVPLPATEEPTLLADLPAIEDPDAVAERIDSDDAWADLTALFEDEPDEGTMGAVQTRTYRLFELMHTVGLWPEHAREASLSKEYGHGHLTNLRKQELNEFATKAFAAAKEKYADA